MYKFKKDEIESKDEPELKDTNKTAFGFLIISLVLIILAIILVIVLTCVKF